MNVFIGENILYVMFLLRHVFIFALFLSEILFGPVGRIKKVKIYTTALGKQKGDALVTFVQAESAGTACIKVPISDRSCMLIPN